MEAFDNVIAWITGDMQIIPEVLVAIRLGLIMAVFDFLGSIISIFKRW